MAALAVTNAELRFPGGVEELQIAATSRNLVNQGYEHHRPEGVRRTNDTF